MPWCCWCWWGGEIYINTYLQASGIHTEFQLSSLKQNFAVYVSCDAARLRAIERGCVSLLQRHKDVRLNVRTHGSKRYFTTRDAAILHVQACETFSFFIYQCSSCNSLSWNGGRVTHRATKKGTKNNCSAKLSPQHKLITTWSRRITTDINLLSHCYTAHCAGNVFLPDWLTDWQQSITWWNSTKILTSDC